MNVMACLVVRLGWVLLLGGSVGAVTSLGTLAFLWALDSLNAVLMWLPWAAHQTKNGAW